MAKPIAWHVRHVLLIAAACTAGAALAQAPAESPAAPPATGDAAGVAESAADPAAAEEATEEVDVVAPGGDIVITGRRERAIEQETTQVISLLSTEDISRTGEGNIAGALSRVTGLSVVSGGFVYVRGLGDRYSLSLLNGSPLPSPEPLRRAVPLDLFPTDVVASSLVQKTYSANYPGEFGGGVINLTTLAIPKSPFLTMEFGGGGDSETTGHLGYDYYGSKSDWSGYDYGNRDTPPALASFLASGQRMSAGGVDSGAIASQFVNANNALVQEMGSTPANYTGTITGGTSWITDGSQLGLIATAGFSNRWRTRDNTEQSPGSADLTVIDKDYRSVATENRAVANGLLGLGYEFGDGQRLRWTNLYIHDTLKRTSLAQGFQNNQRPGADFVEQTTGWYERELLGTQLTGGFELDPVSIDARASYSKSKREAPFELSLGYVRTNQAASPYGAYLINRLDNGQSGHASAAFSDLSEDLYSAGVDVSTRLGERTVLTGGVDFAYTERESFRREFQIIAPSTFPSGVALLQPDKLLGTDVIDLYDIGMVETTESDPAFGAELRTYAGYLQAQTELTDSLELSAGARYERGEQEVFPIQVFGSGGSTTPPTLLDNDYVLPAVTLTWKFAEDMQVRVNGSMTLARPQFRELMYQSYYDPESNRSYRGNPLLVDSDFVNAEARYEWYYAPEQRFSVAGFWKQIDKPIESFTGFNDNTPVTSFANAPEATLYGAELEWQRYVPLNLLSDSSFFASRRAVIIANYTFTDSSINVDAGDTVDVYGTTTQPASNFFTDGSRLTGQSDHLVNLQLGMEASGRLSQQTILLSYAGDRVTSRGAAGLPDIYESPGLRVDLVARENFTLFGQDLQLKGEVRNVFGENYEEFQQLGPNTVYYNRYDVGTFYGLTLSVFF